MSQNWRQNPNLVECFENWQATVRGMPQRQPAGELDKQIAEVRSRRKALGLSQERLSAVFGGSKAFVAKFEAGIGGTPRYRRLSAALDRLEAEAAQ